MSDQNQSVSLPLSIGIETVEGRPHVRVDVEFANDMTERFILPPNIARAFGVGMVALADELMPSAAIEDFVEPQETNYYPPERRPRRSARDSIL